MTICKEKSGKMFLDKKSVPIHTKFSPTVSLIGGHRWELMGFVIWCELGFRVQRRELLTARLGSTAM